jgi:hypothetical protein
MSSSHLRLPSVSRLRAPTWTIPLLILLQCTLSHAAPVTPVNLFHAITVQIPRAPEQPVCCLRPLPPLEPEPEDELLLSFEEWKAKKASSTASASRAAASIAGDKANPEGHGPGHGNAPHSPSSGSSSNIGSSASLSIDELSFSPSSEDTWIAPHFLVPLTDRFNFASLDCSARVHATHKSARGASGILSSKKDRYLLSPCNAQNQHIVVELCDDIRIDTVQLANFEFFSGVFKDLRVSVAKTYSKDPSRWTVVGTYRAKNRRGVQVGDFLILMRSISLLTMVS